jgi:hypothetical protein
MILGAVNSSVLSLKSPWTGAGGTTDPRRLAAPHKLTGREAQLLLKSGLLPCRASSYDAYTGSLGSPVTLRWRKYLAALQYPRVLSTSRMIGIPKPRANLSLMVREWSSCLGASKELVGVAMRIGTVLELLLVACAGAAVGDSVIEEDVAAMGDPEVVLVERVDEAEGMEVEDAVAARPPDNANIGE